MTSIRSDKRIGVLLFNLGGPETLDDVRPFLFNLFADPDIIRLPWRALQKPLAWLISTQRHKKSRSYYEQIGGGSPLRRITEEQASALETALSSRNINARVYVGMRYWNPFIEEALDQIRNDQIDHLVVLPLYPQFSVSTTGSSLNRMYAIAAETGNRLPQTSVVCSWAQCGGVTGISSGNRYCCGWGRSIVTYFYLRWLEYTVDTCPVAVWDESPPSSAATFLLPSR